MDRNELLTVGDLLDFEHRFTENQKKIIQDLGTKFKWIREKELMKLTGWSSPETIRKLRVNGTLKYSKVGTTIFYDLEHLTNYLETNSKNRKHEIKIRNFRETP